MTKSNIVLSVIVPTRNRAKLLDKMLNSLLAQTYPVSSFEVIVVDNGSTDKTREIFEKYEDKLGNYYYVYNSSPGLHIGRHAGLNVAKGEIIVYADDDIRAMPTWLESIYEAFKKNPDVALVGGKNLPEFEATPPSWVNQLWQEQEGLRSCSLFSILDAGNEIGEISPYSVWGCNFSIRKSVLLRIGGFHPDGMPKDKLRYRGDGETAVAKRVLLMGYKTLYHPQASVYHWVSSERMTFSYVFERAYRSGISASYSRIRRNGKKMPKFNLLYIARTLWNQRKIWRKLGVQDQKIDLYRSYADGFKSGYMFHLNEVKKDPELLKWVLKERY